MTKAFVKIAATCALAALTMAGCRSTQEALRIGDAGDRNPGPCPRAFALYNASRIVEFRGEGQRYANVGFTGEINAVRSLCRYYATQPIIGDLELDIALGRGPAAAGQETVTYEYFVAVTRKNVDVIAKQVFPLTVTFKPGQDRMTVRETVDRIVIPRANEGTSGENFEIVVGFVVTPEQRAFNADGRRFRLSAGASE